MLTVQSHPRSVCNGLTRRDLIRAAGSGLLGTSLAIARKTVDLLGGEISAASEIGVGTTFIVRLAATRDT